MVRIQNISKYFGHACVLSDISCHIRQGEIIGFLGQNGAGKTTLMRILTGYLPASVGRVEVDGQDVQKYPLAIRRKIGYLPEVPPLYPNMTVTEYLRLAAELKDVPPKQIRPQVDRVLADCHITDVSRKIIATLSMGYRQRVGLAQAIINDPRVLILDEPTKGLDPIQNLQVRDLIKNLGNKRTVILSTHVLSEIEQIAHRVLIIRDGKIIKDGSLSHILSSCGHRGVQLRVKGEYGMIEKAIRATHGLNAVGRVCLGGDLYYLDLEASDQLSNYNELALQLNSHSVEILEIKEKKKGLEDIFIELNK